MEKQIADLKSEDSGKSEENAKDIQQKIKELELGISINEIHFWNKRQSLILKCKKIPKFIARY